MEITEAPVIDFILDGDTVFYEGNELNVSLTDDYNIILWSTGQTENNIVISTSGIYSVMVTDNTGCSSSDSINILVKPISKFKIVNDILTPNNDGYNDYFMIEEIEAYPDCELFIYNMNGPVFQNVGLGVIFSETKAGIFNASNIQMTYAYHLKINDDQSISFGLGGEITDYFIDFSNTTSQSKLDPVIANYSNVHTIELNACFGITYRFNKFNFGISMPKLLQNDIESKNDTINALFTTLRHYQIFSSYIFTINRLLEIETHIVLNRNDNNLLYYETGNLVKFGDIVWATVIIGKGGKYAIGLGGEIFKSLILNYSYQLTSQALLSNLYSAHTITIGYLIGTRKNGINRYSVFHEENIQPYYKWID